MSQNLYSYCGNNPINMVDPTGHFYYDANGQQSTYHGPEEREPLQYSEGYDMSELYPNNSKFKKQEAIDKINNYLDKVGTTQVLSVTGFVSQIYSKGTSFEFAWDRSGNIAIFRTEHNWIGTQQVSASASYTTTTAKNVESLRGSSGELGFSFPSPLGGGIDIMKGEGYEALQFSVSGSVVPTETHARHNMSDYFVLYDTKNQTMKINLAYVFADVCGAEALYLDAKYRTHTIGDEYIWEINFNGD